MKTSTSRGRFHDGTKPSLRERLWRQGSILLVLLAPLLLLKPPALFAQVQSLVASNTAFALNLYQQLATNQGNLFLSPYSISTCLAMTYDGARGQTEAQMSHVLGFDTNQSQFASDFGQLQIELEASQQTNAIELNIANALWTQTGFPFLPAFLQNASNHFQANINQADFATQGDAARTAINDWIAQETQNKITNMLEPGTINGATRLVLANAIYFLGVWTEAFAISNTTTQPFYLSSNSQVQVPLMHQLTVERTGWGISFNYMETANYQALELPYGSNQVSMLILLPRQIEGWRQLEQQLSPAFLSSVLAQMRLTDVEVYLPRFTLDSTFHLPSTLSNMGMPDAFLPGAADFSGMDSNYDLCISDVIHKAWGEVNESGTQAAASTVVTVVATVAPMPSPVFRADHPFLFFIRDTQSGSLLFMGRLASPTGSASASGVVPQLQLTGTRIGNSLRLSWPYPSTNWALQQNADLTTTNWTPASGVANDGTNSYLLVNPSVGSMFFRLIPQ